ncbi:MAG: hypothetical protein Ct9H300mP28_04140 [Pseudomonadota bacterium]|nr:MAG: hypothetical protein Ct9H300mP28_04140 [Pseudomonadota bacterium]
MFVDIAVRCRVRPICSAIDIKGFSENRYLDRISLSAYFQIGFGCNSYSMPPYCVISELHPGSIRIVEVSCITIAGPSISFLLQVFPAEK